MDLKSLKNSIASIESATSNIESWNKLRNRELAIIPVDSEYYKEFKNWKTEKGHCYDGEFEHSPMFISPSRSEGVLDLMIKYNEEFAKHHINELPLFLDPEKRPEFPENKEKKSHPDPPKGEGGGSK